MAAGTAAASGRGGPNTAAAGGLVPPTSCGPTRRCGSGGSAGNDGFLGPRSPAVATYPGHTVKGIKGVRVCVGGRGNGLGFEG